MKPLIAKEIEGKDLLLLSNSTRQAFTFCPRSFELQYLLGLKRVVEERHFRVGQTVHKCLLAFYEGKGEFEIDTLLEEWQTQSVKPHKEVIANLQVRMQGTIVPDEIDFCNREIAQRQDAINEVATDVAMVRDILARYQERFGNDLEDYEVLAAEQPFIVPIPQKVGDALRLDGTYGYTGVFDLVVRRKSTGQVFLMDHKTTTLTDLASFGRDIEAGGAGQRIGYVYAARYFWPGVSGIVYNVLRKKVPSQVQTLQCKKCKGTGVVETKEFVLDEKGKRIKDEAAGGFKFTLKEEPCTDCNQSGFSGISKTIPDTTVRVFKQCIADLQAKNPSMSMDNVVEIEQELARRGDRFLYRCSLPVDDHDIAEWASDIYEIAHAMGRSVKAKKWYRNLAACNVNGRVCTYYKVCMHGWDGAENWERVERNPFTPAEVVLNSDEED